MVKYNRKNFNRTINRDYDIEFVRNVTEKKGRSSEKSKSLEYLNIGFMLITPLFVGLFLGLYADEKFRTKPIFVLIGIGFGLVGTFYNLFRITKE